MYRRLILAALAAAAICVPSVAHSQDRWNVLATREIDLGKHSETIDLSRTRGSIKAVGIEVESGNVQLLNIEVTYLNWSEVYDEKRNVNLKEGERTRPIDQQKVERFLQSITLTYKPRPGKKATIEISGLQSPKGATAARPTETTGPIVALPTLPVPTTQKPGIPGEGGAVLFGFQYAGFLRDRDVIKVGSDIGQFDRLQIRVLDNDIFINEVNVVYVGGERQKLIVNADLKRNTRSRWLDINGGKFIDRLEFTYRSKPSIKGQARVEVFGELVDDWLGPNGRGRKYNEGWVLLGAQTASRYLRNETDVIPVSRNQGGYKRIRVRVMDRDLLLSEIRVVFDDNQEEVFKTTTKVTSGTNYGPIDLKVGTQIKLIRATYRSAILDPKTGGKGASRVEIWGQH